MKARNTLTSRRYAKVGQLALLAKTLNSVDRDRSLANRHNGPYPVANQLCPVEGRTDAIAIYHHRRQHTFDEMSVFNLELVLAIAPVLPVPLTR